MEILKNLQIRNIHTHIYEALASLASKNNRSVEGEARQAIGVWVQPEISDQESDNRLIELSRRLNDLLEQANDGRKGAPLKPSHIAQQIGEASAGETLKWFLGKTEPSFTQLAAVAKLLGADKDWLLHGDKTMYAVNYVRLSTDAKQSAEWLMNWEPDNQEVKEEVSEIHFLRENSKEGKLVIVKLSQQGHPKIFTTPIHVSQETGSGGRASLAHFAATLALLYKYNTRLGTKLTVSSCIVKEADLTQILGGKTHPSKIIQRSNGVVWWEDIWDKKSYPKHDYWPGWRALCESIEETTMESSHLTELRRKIGETTLPALEDKMD